VEKLLAADEKEPEPTAWANHERRRGELTATATGEKEG
jgi:hypothetical protein